MTNESSNLSNQNKKIRKKRKRLKRENLDESSDLINKAPNLKKKRRKRKRIGENNLDAISMIEHNERIVDKTNRVTTDSKQEGRNSIFETDVDNSSIKKNRNRVLFVVGLLIITFLLCLFCYFHLSQVKVPNFVDKSITDVTKWANENAVKIETKKEYSSTVKSDYVLKQSPVMNKKIKKGSRLNITISKGFNPEEYIKLPDFSSMTENTVNEFIKQNNMVHATIQKEYSDKIDEGQFIKLEFGDKGVTNDTYQRKDSLTIYFSKGEEPGNNKVLIPDFSSKTKNDVEEWAKKNNISVTYEEVDSEKPKGSVIKMSSKEQYIPKDSHITVGISNGQLNKQIKDTQRDLQETDDSSRIEIKGKG